MNVHLVDGTFELFRAYFSAPASTSPGGQEVGATRGLMRSLAALVNEDGVTHVAVAFDHVVESFRNDLFDGYKTGEGLEAELYDQFPLAEQACRALGIVCWPMVEYEADDALAAGAAKYKGEPGVEQVIICSPDKDLAQMVVGKQVVTLDRIRKTLRDEDGVVEKFGVRPASIPDWLALVGDTADGIPGIPRWGAKSASTVLARYERIDAIPEGPNTWEVKVRGAAALAENLNEARQDAALYRELATLRTDVPLEESLEDLRYRGADAEAVEAFCAEIGERPERFGSLTGRTR